VRVASGDVNGDGINDVVVAAGPGGGPQVNVYDGTSLQLVHSFYAYNALFDDGIFVAVGDVNGDGYADIITGAGQGGGPHVQYLAARIILTLLVSLPTIQPLPAALVLLRVM